jgi:hypothetical protein
VALTLPAALLLSGSAPALEGDVRIQSLDCDAEPEVIILGNNGSDAQSVEGWKLQSDPVASETMDLTSVGELLPEGTVTIQSGTGAAGAFRWSTSEVFRDGDATDFARLVDETGKTVQQVACQPATTPTPSPAPAPGGVPDGGGPPASDSPGPAPALAVTAGGWLIVTGLAALVLPWLRVAAGSAAVPEAPPVEAPKRRRASDHPRGLALPRPLLSRNSLATASAVLGVAALLALLLASRPGRRS